MGSLIASAVIIYIVGAAVWFNVCIRLPVPAAGDAFLAPAWLFVIVGRAGLRLWRRMHDGNR